MNLTVELNRTKSTLHEKKESVKVLLQKCEKFDEIGSAFGVVLAGCENSQKSVDEKQADCEALNALLKDSFPNLDKSMVDYTVWRYESLTFWEKIKFVFWGR